MNEKIKKETVNVDEPAHSVSALEKKEWISEEPFNTDRGGLSVCYCNWLVDNLRVDLINVGVRADVDE